jgi:hypothetical protein
VHTELQKLGSTSLQHFKVVQLVCQGKLKQGLEIPVVSKNVCCQVDWVPEDTPLLDSATVMLIITTM